MPVSQLLQGYAYDIISISQVNFSK